MTWGGLDAVYDLADQSAFPDRHHTLVWAAQQPNRIAGLPQGEQLEEVQQWFEGVAERYPEIDFLEVVNEPLPQKTYK